MRRFRFVILLVLILSLLTACSLPGLSEDSDSDVLIAAGNTTERQILAYVVEGMVNYYTDLNTNVVNNLGSTTLIHIGMANEDINVSGAMYTGTSITGELGLDPILDSDLALEVCQREYLDRFNRLWYDSYGFENTYAFMVRDDFAREHNLSKVSELEAMKDDIQVGVDQGWIDREGDGYEDFQKKYGFAFDNIYPMDLGLIYTAIANGELDVGLGYSTDGRIDSYDLVLLEDDLNLFPAYDVSPVSSKELVDKYPILDSIFKSLAGSIDETLMQEMNRMADEDLIEPKNVALKFLEDNNYFEDEVDL